MDKQPDLFAVRIVFLWVGWMNRYQGITGGDTISSGGAYVAEHGFGHEIFTYQPSTVDGQSALSIDCDRAHRFGVLWRKRRQGTCSEKGNRWVEQILSLRHTCRVRGRPTFSVLVEAVACLFKGERPDLSWIRQHESLLVLSTP